jgi:predicted proteasome-type protease
MRTILVFEIKEGKNAQKVKKNINPNLSLLISGGYNGRRPRVWGHNPQKNFEI